jgi:hypothetical protein
MSQAMLRYCNCLSGLPVAAKLIEVRYGDRASHIDAPQRLGGPSMDIEIARQVVRTAFRSSAMLRDLLTQLKRQCTADEYQDYARGVAAAVDAIGVGLIAKAIAGHPELEAEIEASIPEHGRFV